MNGGNLSVVFLVWSEVKWSDCDKGAGYTRVT